MLKVNDKLMNKDIKCIIWLFLLVGWLYDRFYDMLNI